MKKLIAPVCFLLMFFSASAQMTQDDVNLIQAIYGKEKRDLVQEYMHLNDSSSASFWKLYDSYEIERKKLGQDYIRSMEEYGKNYEALDNAKADALVKNVSANNIAFENLYVKYYNKMKPVVGALKAAQFFQAEAYLKSVIKTAILDEIPFIGEIDRSRKQ